MVLSAEDLSAAPFSQAHVFEGASDEQKQSFVTQLNEIDSKLPGGGLQGYLERARGLLAEAKTGSNPFEGLKPKVPNGTKLTGDDGPGSNRYAECERLGMQELSKTCFCLVAGGLGERLGYPGIKIGITAEVTTGATFLEIYCRHILAFQAYARKATGNATLELPLAIMTSGDTHQMTLDLLQANRRFGLSTTQLTVMKQEKVPALMDVDARIAVKDGNVLTKPHGHGDVHSLLHQNGLPAKWIGEGKSWLLLFQDTNPLPFRSICAVLGVSAAEKFVLNSVTVPRFPGEAVGGIATLEKENGESLTVNVEYNQLDPLLKTTPVGGDVADESGFSPYPGNINILVFGLGAMAERLATTGGIVPEFCNPKWADAERNKFKSPTRLECMMQDFPRLLGPNDKVGFTMLERLMCFTCVKNALEEAAKKTPQDCALSAEADIYACNARLLSLAGADVQIEAAEDVSFLGVTAKMGPRIILHPSFGVSLEDMKAKVQGKWRISRRSVLVLDGDVTVTGLDLDGALTVTGPGSAADVVVKNAGRELVAIPEADLSKQSPSLQIRGYNLTAGEVSVMRLGPQPTPAFRVVFVRHGESQWNVANIFTGWHDIDLSPNGHVEAVEAGKCLKEKGFKFDIVFTSVLRRAIRTAWTVLTESENFSMPIINSWRLNERHYGDLQGMNKAETAAKHGDDQVKIWRRSFDIPPPSIEVDDPRHPGNDPMYASVPKAALPGAESLKMVIARVLPVWFDQIAPCIMSGKSVMVAAHGNSLRAICMYLEGMSEAEVLEFNIPTAVPLMYELDQDLKFIRKEYLMDEAEVKAKVAAVAAQGKAAA